MPGGQSLRPRDEDTNNKISKIQYNGRKRREYNEIKMKFPKKERRRNEKENNDNDNNDQQENKNAKIHLQYQWSQHLLDPVPV